MSVGIDRNEDSDWLTYLNIPNFDPGFKHAVLFGIRDIAMECFCDFDPTSQANFCVYDIVTSSQLGLLPSPLVGTFVSGVVPEPAALTAFGLGAAALLRPRRR